MNDFYFQQFILRLPLKLSEQVNQILNNTKSNDNNGVHIEVIPQDSFYFEFVFGEQRYPALLGNLPCNIETHKTFDHITYYKSGDISQMLQVFETEAEREKAKSERKASPSLNLKCFPSGITAPTHKIIEKKFSKTRKQKAQPSKVVSQVEHEIVRYTTGDVIEDIYEEVVDFEKFMADAANPEGKTFTFTGQLTGPEALIFLEHPEILLTSADEELKNKLENASNTSTIQLPTTAPLTSINPQKKSNTPTITTTSNSQIQSLTQKSTISLSNKGKDTHNLTATPSSQIDANDDMELQSDGDDDDDNNNNNNNNDDDDDDDADSDDSAWLKEL